jgi:hypothetical protein
MMKDYHVAVTQRIRVTIEDESKFTPEWMEDFRKSFYQIDTIQDHAEHLAQLYARGIIPWFDSNPFVEGYGRLAEMGISISDEYTDMETEHVEERSA